MMGQINGHELKEQLDAASDITLISREAWGYLGRPAMIPTKVGARNASGGVLNLDEVECRILSGDYLMRSKCSVTNQPGLDLINKGLVRRFDVAEMNEKITQIAQRIALNKLSQKNP